jgi:hypothetical protein
MLSIKSTKQRYLHYYRKRSVFSAFPLLLRIKRIKNVDGKKCSILAGENTLPVGARVGKSSWARKIRGIFTRPLWSPAILLSCVRNNAIIARCFHLYRWSKRLLRGVRACNLLVMPQFKINGSRQSFLCIALPMHYLLWQSFSHERFDQMHTHRKEVAS